MCYINVFGEVVVCVYFKFVDSIYIVVMGSEKDYW